MEGRQRETTLSPVQIALAQQDSLADELPPSRAASALQEVVIVVDENIADALWTVDEVDVVAPHAERPEVAVLACEFEHKVMRVAAALVDESPEEGVSLRAGRLAPRARSLQRAPFLSREGGGVFLGSKGRLSFKMFRVERERSFNPVCR